MLVKANNILQQSKRFLFPWLLLFWLFCLPLALAVYTPFLYQANCQWNERCEQMGQAKTQQSISELTAFFRHQSDKLKRPWTPKESIHLYEVRVIYDKVIVAFAIISSLFFLDILITAQSRQHYTRYARHSLFINTTILLLALLIAPFFNAFWIKVFHPLLFDNELWRTNPGDISWYLMPKSFFLRVIIFLCVSTWLLNFLLWRLGSLCLPKQATRLTSVNSIRNL